MGQYGRYVKLHGKLYANYPETGDAFPEMVEDYYSSVYSFAKSAGAATYGDNGYFNAIMGKQITAAMFSSDNVFAAIGARPYVHEGVRMAVELADYGLDENGSFVGLGAQTVQDGRVPDSVSMPVDECREPYKDNPFSFDYGLGLMALEGKDDTIAYKDYMDKISANYSDLADKTILRPVWKGQPTVGTVETSMNSISRIVSSYEEIGLEEHGVTITGNMVSPYGGMGASLGDFYNHRTAELNNYSSQLINLANGSLTVDDVRRLYRNCLINWADNGSPNNKCWFMSNLVVDKMSQEFAASNLYFDSVYAQRSFNGVKTFPGRDTGLLLKSYQNIPIIPDGNLNFDFTSKRVSGTEMGEVYLLDLDHIWMSVLTPVQMYSVDNPAITRMLREINTMNSRMETRVDSFIQHGKIVNIGESP